MSKVTWIVIADSSKAKIFRLLKFPHIEPLLVFDHPESRLRNQDLVTSTPGRNFQRTTESRSAYQSKHSPKQVEANNFAAALGQFLSSSFNNGEFAGLYLFASPEFLGLLRPHLHPNLHHAIINEVAKDMTSYITADIEKQLAEL